MVMKFQRQKQRVKNKDLLTLKNHGEGIRFFRFEMVPFHGTFVHFFWGGGKGVKQNMGNFEGRFDAQFRQSNSKIRQIPGQNQTTTAKHVADSEQLLRKEHLSPDLVGEILAVELVSNWTKKTSLPPEFVDPRFCKAFA